MIHLRCWEGSATHPQLRAACSPPWTNDRGEYTFEWTDNPDEVTCKACLRSKRWGDANIARYRPDVVGHKDADGITRLEWKDDQIRETLISRELLEQLVEQGNRLQRILKATQCEHDFRPVDWDGSIMYCGRCGAQASVAGPVTKVT